ncbi:hypothetical protein [Mycoplasma sp. ATU-Cv-508]|uniref:hypothetical protein n=1 Tax=Mycoplasma sp. ATU-Cv-508 TaxID=2048001 RepID=UPI001374DF05
MEWPFEKWIKLNESYNDYQLGKIGPGDIQINQDLLPPFPTSHLPAGLFEVNPRFRVLSVRYLRPPANAKEVEVNVKVGTLTKSVIIGKQITFKQSREEHKNSLRDQNMFSNARIFSPNLIKIAVDLSGEPVLEVTPKWFVAFLRTLITGLIISPLKLVGETPGSLFTLKGLVVARLTSKRLFLLSRDRLTARESSSKEQHGKH